MSSTLLERCFDPSQRNLTVVQDFLVAQNTTAFHLLSQAMDKHTSVQQLQANNNLSGLNEAASTWEFAQSPGPWKKAKRPAVETRPF